MKNLTFILITLVLIVGFSYSAQSALLTFVSEQVGTTPVNGYVLQTNGTNSSWVATTTLGITANASIATSSSETSGYVPFWTSTSGTPALLSGGESTFVYDSSQNRLTVTNASSTALSATATSTFASGLTIGTGYGLKFDAFSTIPQIFADSDNDTGIMFDGPDIMSFHTGGAERVVINAAGRFGVATSAPGTLFSIGGNGTGINLVDGTSATSTFSGHVNIKGNLKVDGNASFAVNLQASTLTSALLQVDASGNVQEYAGTSCTNQFVRSLSALGVATCATVANTDLANSTISGIALGSNLADLTATNSTLTFSGTYNGSTARTIGLNLGNANAWTVLQTFALASSTQFSAGTSDVFYIDSNGKVTIKDTNNNLSGIQSPTKAFVLGSATSTTWTASTTGTGYSPFLIMPFAGTIDRVRCGTDASFLGVNVKVNGSNATPSYFVASSTIGIVPFTAGNTFTAGQKILANFGTTTTASTLEINCTFDVRQTS